MPSFLKLVRRSKKVPPSDKSNPQGETERGSTSEAEEQYGLFDLGDNPPSEALFDVVAVHGLGGHYRNTWTAENGKLWLRDFLPLQLQTIEIEARILSYGYNSTTAFSKAVTDINDEAEMLLNRIWGERSTDEEKARPIFFVAHSLGGILVKKAMIIAHERSDIYGGILDRIHGVAFFGTPHRGSDLAWWADFSANLLKALELGRGTNTTYVEGLKRNSKTFSHISQQWIERAKALDIRTYYETERMHGLLVVDKDSARLNLPNEIPVGIAGANHRTICKFENENSQKYKQIWNALKIIAATIRETALAASKTDDTGFKINEQHKQFLQSLCFSDYEADRRRNPEREKGTCEWIINHKQFKSWESDERASILWISGDPGCGKSVAASFLIDHVRTSTDCSPPAFYFFKDDSDRQSSATKALCALLHQILSSEDRKPLVEHAMTDYTNWGSELFESLDKLWAIFASIISDPMCGKITIVLDALDECKEVPRARLMGHVVAFCNAIQPRSNQVKFLMTSRPYAAVQKAFKNFQMIRLKTEDSVDEIDQDVKRVIDARIARFAENMDIREDSRLASLQGHLHSKADRTFLWVSLILDMLDGSADCSYAELEEIIDTENPSIDALYEKILEKAKDTKKAQRMLHFVVSAAEPLTVAELNVAWAVKVGDGAQEYKLEDRMFPSPERGIKEVCGLFVRIIENTVVLVHQTARGFLVRTAPGSPLERPPGKWKHCLDPLESNKILAEVCLSFLLIKESAEDVEKCDDPAKKVPEPPSSNASRQALAPPATIEDASWAAKRNETSSEPIHAIEKHAAMFHASELWYDKVTKQPNNMTTEPTPLGGRNKFMLHATQHWYNYYTNVGSADRGGVQYLVLGLFGDDKVFNAWFSRWTPPGSGTRGPSNLDLTPLIISTYLGLDTVVSHLLGSGHDAEQQDSRKDTALVWAVRNKQYAAAEVLLNHKVDTELNAGHGTVLHLAVRLDCARMVRLLLDHDADDEAKDMTKSIPLHYAQSKEVVKLLLRHNETEYLETADWNGFTPLLRAAARGNLGVVECLLQNGANAKAVNNGSSDCITLAQYHKHTVLAKYLQECKRRE